MKKVTTITTTTYKTEIEGFYVEITKTDEISAYRIIEAYIYHKEYGVKMLMFGEYLTTEKEFIETVEGNIKMYADIYREKYMDE